MQKLNQRFFNLGSISMGLCVALGAIGAHLLKKELSVKSLEVFHTGVRYHLIHSLSLIVLSLLPQKINIKWSGYLFLIGIIFFSFGCYAYSISTVKAFVHIVPIGGFSFILGWVILFLKNRKNLEKD